MQRVNHRADLGVGSALALLAVAVLWSARSFPVVPGQKVGAGFLPTLVGAGLLVCAVVLIWRGLRVGRSVGRDIGRDTGHRSAAIGDAAGVLPEGAGPLEGGEHYGSATVIVVVIAGYLLLADRLGFLIVAPVALVALFRGFKVGWPASWGWALGGTLLVHFAFYKLLRVPLPWGVLRPFY